MYVYRALLMNGIVYVYSLEKDAGDENKPLTLQPCFTHLFPTPIVDVAVSCDGSVLCVSTSQSTQLFPTQEVIQNQFHPIHSFSNMAMCSHLRINESRI